MNRVVITGGPATGKTSLITEFKGLGYQIFPEVARVVIKQQLALNSIKVPWLDVSGFSQLVLEEQCHHFKMAKNSLSFFDRGIPDIIGYLNHANQPFFDSLIDTAENLKYNFIFILPPWEEIYETDNERREEFFEATKLFKAINDAYIRLGYQTIEVPKLTVKERIQFILDHIK